LLLLLHCLAGRCGLLLLLLHCLAGDCGLLLLLHCLAGDYGLLLLLLLCWWCEGLEPPLANASSS
jgi:hypothetical protein